VGLPPGSVPEKMRRNFAPPDENLSDSDIIPRNHQSDPPTHISHSEMSHHHSHGQSCNSESHDHDHSHGGEHSHDGESTHNSRKTDPCANLAGSRSDDLTPAIQSSLYQHIEFDKIVTFNEAALGSGKAIIQKPWDRRLDTSTVLESDADEQLLIYVPYALPQPLVIHSHDRNR